MACLGVASSVADGGSGTADTHKEKARIYLKLPASEVGKGISYYKLAYAYINDPSLGLDKDKTYKVLIVEYRPDGGKYYSVEKYIIVFNESEIVGRTDRSKVRWVAGAPERDDQ